MRTFNPTTQARDSAAADVKRIGRDMAAEKAADPAAFAAECDAAKERAQRYQRMARGNRA
ncbi:UNVERIFIED_ORG: hypothetical protein M2348_001298 [Sphingomonas sp. R1F5B]